MLLLPTQEMLVQRLQHIASYSEQLLVLCGGEGSGKSTLATVLASELDEVNSALVVCPLHVDSSEIRRKIWIQLVSDPIFDDELPLTDTLLRIQSYLTKPLHIIIDDAHLLPKVLWAECILLSQMATQGHKVSVTFTIDTRFWSSLIAELAEPMRALLLQVMIEPLAIAEREALYQTLLLRSEQDSFTPRRIVTGLLEKQSGKPSEVVSLFAKDSNVSTPTKSWRRFLPKLMSFLILLFSISAWWLFTSPNLWQSNLGLSVKPATLASQVTNIQGLWLDEHGKALLSTYWWTRSTLDSAHSAPSLQLLDPIATKPLVYLVPLVRELQHDKQPSLQASEASTLPLNHETSPPLAKLPAVHVKPIADVSTLSSPVNGPAAPMMQATKPNLGLPLARAVKDKALSAPSTKAPFKAGYTLQLANVTKKASLTQILNKIPSNDRVFMARSSKGYLLFLGQYSTESQAKEKATSLKKLGFAEPWIRKWRDLQQYEFE